MVLSEVKAGIHEDVAVLFSDVRNFTRLTDDISIEDLMHILRIYYDEMAGIIIANNGIVGTFVGDAIVGYFGIKTPKNGADDAASAALQIKEQIRFINIGREIQFLNGIGLDKGPIIVGTVSCDEVIEQQIVVGNPINRASRFERLTRRSCHRIIMPKLFCQDLSSTQKKYFVDIGRVEVRGLPGLIHVCGDIEAQQ